MKISKINPLSLFSILGLLGLLGIFTDNIGWYGFFGWFSWIRYIKYPVDERFSRNVSKAGLIGFCLALLCFMVLIVLKATDISMKVYNISLALSFLVLTFGFILSFTYYEKLGN